MAHTTWIYADGSGINHTIGLYHGNIDGHVAIYCDKKIIQIDFGVKTNEIYSFFLFSTLGHPKSKFEQLSEIVLLFSSIYCP